jgi:non-specific serine/threonine protein kinase
VGATRDDRSVVSRAIGTAHAHVRGGDPPEAEIHLTARQDDILRLVAEGLSDKQIAGRLGVRRRTVSKHLERLYERLKVPNRAAAAAGWAEHRWRKAANRQTR